MTQPALVRNHDEELQGCVVAFFRQNDLFVLTLMGQQLLFLEKPINREKSRQAIRIAPSWRAVIRRVPGEE
jgi:hypothetical protein